MGKGKFSTIRKELECLYGRGGEFIKSSIAALSDSLVTCVVIECLSVCVCLRNKNLYRHIVGTILQ